MQKLSADLAYFTSQATCAHTFNTCVRRVPMSNSRGCLQIAASTTMKDATTGVEFPVAQRFWEGEVMRCLGTGTRVKKIVFVNVKVYTASVYVEADRCAKEFLIRKRGGFFETNDDYCQAIMDGAFHKVLVVHLVRDVEGPQFTEALQKYLLPRLTLSGEQGKLQEFEAYFSDKKLTNNTEVVLFWNNVGDLEVLVAPPGSTGNYEQAKPELRIRSVGMCRGLFEVFLGEGSVVPDARKEWAQNARNLLESEIVKRDSRKGGSG